MTIGEGTDMSREENVEIFRDTERLVKTLPQLKEAVRNSTENQKLILETDKDYGVDKEREAWVSEFMERETDIEDLVLRRLIANSMFTLDGETPARVAVTKRRSFEAASVARERYRSVCVHNFASATTPGGGVTKGSSAQEEALCRCSTLYFSLNTPEMWGGFYTPHRNARDPRHNDDIIYTPGVHVIKSDTDSPVLMPEADWFDVNVITCAAPNLRQMPSNGMNTGDGVKKIKMNDEELQALHKKRLRRILQVAEMEKNEAVILGAFGCGAFENDPEVVAKAAANAVKDYLCDFSYIEFAVYCPPGNDRNYRVFDKVLSPLNSEWESFQADLKKMKR